MLNVATYEAEQRAWLAQQFESIQTVFPSLQPSEWAEQKRYLPPGVTPLPGPYRFDVAPYLREIVDCFNPESPIRQVSVMKGVQLCFTVGVLENLIGYLIDHVRTSACMWITADAELAQQRLGSYVVPMLEHSGIAHLIRSADEQNSRKSGKTDRMLEWGTAFLLPLGAQNEAKLSSVSVEWLLRDEVDRWPASVGKDGDPIKLSTDRTAAYEQSRKLLDLSTPTIAGQSKIEDLYEQGDKRHYYVCCLACGYPQVLRWKHVDNDTGVESGITWKMDGDRLVPGSVRYLCEKCAHPHINDDKTRLLDPANGAAWRPTAQPANPYHRSYHLGALYSPVGMQTWEACVLKWLDAWDVQHDRPKDTGKLQVFYNNVLGKAFELRGEKVRFDAVSSHRRSAYRFGEVPNGFATRHCTSPVLLVTAAVDVHGDQLPVAVFGWCRGGRAFLLDYRRLQGDTDQLDDPGTWGALRDLIENRVYTADDGKLYRPRIVMIDAQYRTDHVYRFAADYNGGVFPLRGREQSARNVTDREFSPFTTPTGVTGFSVVVDRYKDRLSSILRREWHGLSVQPAGHFNAPVDVTEKQLKELTAETKVLKPGSARGYEWKRPSGAANELWDLYVYNTAALEILAWDVCVNAEELQELELKGIDWPTFWDFCEHHAPFIEPEAA